MKPWRQILGYRIQEQELTVGSRVRVIADNELLNYIGVQTEAFGDDETEAYTGNVLVIKSIESEEQVNYGEGPNNEEWTGEIEACKVLDNGDFGCLFGYPYSAWREFFEII